jgi:Holliday junction resolvase RusA-like endonuclease
MKSPSNIWIDWYPNEMFTLWIPRSPVPASRPRVGRWGAYYTGSYEKYRKEMPDFIEDLLVDEGIHKPLFVNQPIVIRMAFILDKPRTTTLSYPDCDIDNLEKAIYDQLTSLLWDDDSRIVKHEVHKRWSSEDCPPGVFMQVGTNGEAFKKETKRQASRKRTVSAVSSKRTRRKG